MNPHLIVADETRFETSSSEIGDPNPYATPKTHDDKVGLTSLFMWGFGTIGAIIALIVIVWFLLPSGHLNRNGGGRSWRPDDIPQRESGSKSIVETLEDSAAPHE